MKKRYYFGILIITTLIVTLGAFRYFVSYEDAMRSCSKIKSEKDRNMCREYITSIYREE